MLSSQIKPKTVVKTVAIVSGLVLAYCVGRRVGKAMVISEVHSDLSNAIFDAISTKLKQKPGEDMRDMFKKVAKPNEVLEFVCKQLRENLG